MLVVAGVAGVAGVVGVEVAVVSAGTVVYSGPECDGISGTYWTLDDTHTRVQLQQGWGWYLAGWG